MSGQKESVVRYEGRERKRQGEGVHVEAKAGYKRR
jgi:hypothetical protein